ncbi:hypothetical protein [Hyphomicrobium sp.]|uniref:hypothetical protein n=1 Tax=Hyphomicrobium sp. TaxID=82 RepID=UPI002B8D584D|nr:hypothetical protein [Hyphomicrobium sp.]HRN89620.1 hypothetical protein [Hyphomicrobium sp.]HRQ26720.1 hypothetical protein [Hyphomicrobium sp.]
MTSLAFFGCLGQRVRGVASRIGQGMVAFIVGLMMLACAVQAGTAASHDDTARVLAGLAPSAGSPLENVTQQAVWQAHATYFDRAWGDLEQRQLGKIRAWSARYVEERRPVVYYMFSGPDFLYADTFFEGAETYVLSGLEPVGPVPDLAGLTPRQLKQELRGLQGSLNSVLSFSFFITKKMKTQLNTGRLTGTLPLLYTFLARSGKTVKETTLVSLNPDGTVAALQGPIEKGQSPGVRITFSKAGAAPGARDQTLYYFNTDLSNWGLKSSGFLTFCKGLGEGDGFIKSASYLLHSNNFTDIRAFLLENTTTLVQDDSGVPLRFFEAGTWRLKPFGRYLKPLGIFPRAYQRDMHDLYAKGGAEPLDFGIGYRWRPKESNLMLAVRRPALRADAAP